MTNLDITILEIIRKLERLEKKAVDVFDILREIYYFNEELAVTDGVPVATGYTPVTTLETMTIRTAKVTE